MLMQVVRPEWLVGIEPRGAAQLRGLLDDAAASLDACAGRVQRLLDESGVACTVPQEIRNVGRTCVGTAEDLAGRTRLVEGGEAGRSRMCPVVPLPTDSGRSSSAFVSPMALARGSRSWGRRVQS